MAYKIICDYITFYGFFKNLRIFKKANEIILYKSDKSLIDIIWIASFRLLNFIFLRKQFSINTLKYTMYYPINPEVVEIIEKNTEGIDEGLASKMYMFLKGSEKDIVKNIKRNLINTMQKKLYIKKQIEKNNKRSKCLIVTNINHFDIYSGLCEVYEDNYLFKNRLLTCIIKLIVTIFIFFKILLQFKVSFKIKEKFYTDLLVQTQHHGYGNDIKKEFLSEDYVFDKQRVALLITNLWRPASSIEIKEYKRKLNEKGIRCIDVREFYVDIQAFLMVCKGLLKYAISVDIVFRSWSSFYTYFLALYQYLLESIYLQNYHCKSILCFDSFLSLHIVRTLLYRQRGIKSLGVQHSMGAGLHTGPSQSCLLFDKYLIWGDYYRRTFYPFWEEIDTVMFSYDRIDRFLLNKEKGSIAGKSDCGLLPNSKKHILIAIPQVQALKDQSFLGNAEGMLMFLQKLDDNIFDLANVYIGPKTSDGITQLKKYINNHRIKFLDESKCTTTELISLSDLVIAPAGSGVMCECSLLRKKVIGYDYFGKFLSKFWIRYGKDACIDNCGNLRNVLLKFLSNGTIEVNWEKLWDEVVYPNNGNTNLIIEKLI